MLLDILFSANEASCILYMFCYFHFSDTRFPLYKLFTKPYHPKIEFVPLTCELGVDPLCVTVLHGSLQDVFVFHCLFQTPPEKQQRPKSLQLGDRRLTLSLFQGVSSPLSLSNPLSPLPASPHTPRTPRSSSM